MANQAEERVTKIPVVTEIEEVDMSQEAADMSGVVLTWRTKELSVSPECIYSTSEMSFSRGIETKDQKKSKQQYVQFKTTSAGEFKCTIPLHTILGVDVADEIEAWYALQDGTGAKLYAGGMAVMDCPFMLKQVEVKGYKVGTDGAPYQAELALTFAQSGVAGAEKAATTKKKKKKKKKKSSSGAAKPTPEKKDPMMTSTRLLQMQEQARKRNGSGPIYK